jgi:hypothetical protein
LTQTVSGLQHRRGLVRLAQVARPNPRRQAEGDRYLFLFRRFGIPPSLIDLLGPTVIMAASNLVSRAYLKFQSNV